MIVVRTSVVKARGVNGGERKGAVVYNLYFASPNRTGATIVGDISANTGRNIDVGRIID